MNVKHRNCARPGCYTRPAFNFPGEGKGQYCNKHKVGPFFLSPCVGIQCLAAFATTC